MEEITPTVIVFKINSFCFIVLGSSLFRLSNLYFLDVLISAYVTTEVMAAIIRVSYVIEFVCITDPAKTGKMPHEKIVDMLLWNLPPNNSKLYAKRKNPSIIPIGISHGESNIAK